MSAKHSFANLRSGLNRFGFGLLFVLWTAAALRPAGGIVHAAPAAVVSSNDAPETVQVALSAAGTSASWDSRLPEVEQFDLPVVYLNRSEQPAAKADRTLSVSISGLAGGTPVELELVSWHVNRATWEQERQAARLFLPDRDCTQREPCTIHWVLDASVLSDYYRLSLRDGQGDLLWENPDPERPDVAILDTWEVPLDGYTLRVIYARLFEFARGEKARYHRLPPEAVPDFIAGQIVPILVDTWRTQFGDWEFGPIHEAWDADQVVEVIFVGRPFALLGGTGTYTASTYEDGRPYPERRIWI